MCDIVEQVLALGRIAGLRLESERRPAGGTVAGLPKRPNRTRSDTLRRLARRRARRYGLICCHQHAYPVPG